MTISLCTIIIYAKDMQQSARFYSEHFGFATTGKVVEGLIELKAPDGGASILLHQAAKSLKTGHAGIKLSFDVPDVQAFVDQAIRKNLAFGPVHQANGYAFANTKDPDGNSVSVSSRRFRGV